MGARFWLTVIGLCVGAGIAGAIVFLLSGWLWAAWGFLGAFLFFTVVALVVGHLFDRRERRNRLAA